MRAQTWVAVLVVGLVRGGLALAAFQPPFQGGGGGAAAWVA